jgi:hypothetical protein
MSQAMLLQLGGVGLGVALGKNPAMANQVLQAYGILGGVGVALPFGRSQETEADHIGLILMAKAGYDPRVALDLWQRMEAMEKKDGAKGRPPEFLSTHPGYETRVQNIRSFLPEALSYYQPSNARLETLPLPESLDTPVAKSEREVIKRMEAINSAIEQQNGERAVVEALAYELRMSPQSIVQERQTLQTGYGQYAGLRGIAYLGRGSLNRVVDEYQRGRPWSEIATSNGIRLNDLTVWFGDLIRTTNNMGQQLQRQQPRQGTRYR